MPAPLVTTMLVVAALVLSASVTAALFIALVALLLQSGISTVDVSDR